MRSLFRIIRRYSLTVGLIILIILISNGCLLAGILYFTAGQEGVKRYSRMSLEMMEQIGEELKETGEGGIGAEDGEGIPTEVYVLSEKGLQILETSEFVWAMALNQEGEAIWQWNLPPEIPRQYTIQDVAKFTRWYLQGYPVKVLISGDLLLVFGCDPNLISRFSLFISSGFVKHVPAYGKAVILINLLVIILFILFFGYRFYGSMKPIAQGIENLAAQKPVHLKEKGAIGELAGKLNETSRLLLSQNEALAKRDFARTEWIAGVSHDIRTPLSLIVGHSDRLAKDESLTVENRMLAENIRRQSLIIRQLIADLNLTSKLAYQAQPLKKSRFLPACLVRSCVSDFYNEGLETGKDGKYEFDIVTDDEMEQIQIEADEGLVMRALRNLLGNSIRHNPKGCQVKVNLKRHSGFLVFLVEDTGSGIPEEVVENMANPESRIHIMGLRLTEQIARAHGGKLEFIRRTGGGYDAGLWLPSKKNPC